MINEQSQAASRALSDAEQLTNLVMQTYAEARREVKAEIERLFFIDLADIPKEQWFEHLRKQNRLKILLAKIDRNYLNYAALADRRTREAVKIAALEGYARYQYVLKYFSPINLGINASFSGLPLPLADVIVYGNLKKFDDLGKKVRRKFASTYGSIRRYVPQYGTLNELLLFNRKTAINSINRSITSGIIQGKGARKIADDIGKIIGDKSSGAAYKSFRIARTETIRSLNDGAYAAMQEISDLGVKQQKMWVATTDLRTRDSHQALDGQKRDMDEDFYGFNSSGPRPGSMGSASENINCRCRVVSVFNDVKPEARKGKNPLTGETGIFKWKDYDAWKTTGGSK